MAHSGSTSPEKLGAESDLPDAAALERLQTIQPRMMPYNTPALLARMPNKTEELQMSSGSGLGPPMMPVYMRKNGFPDYLPSSGPPSHASNKYNQLHEVSNISQHPTPAPVDDERQKDPWTGSSPTPSGPVRPRTGTPENLDLEIPNNQVQDRPTEPSESNGSQNTQHGARKVFQPSPNVYERSRPMKHLTCYFWYYWRCKYKEEDCLYAHRETGHIANAPILVGPGHSIAGSNLQNYLHNQQAVFKDHRGAQGLDRASRKETSITRRGSVIDPAIQQQIDNITAKVQYQHYLDSYNAYVASTQFNPQFAAIVDYSTADIGGPLPSWDQRASVTSLPSDITVAVEQPSPGIFSPPPPAFGPNQPADSPSPYSLPPPAGSAAATNHPEYEKKAEELRSKLSKLEADNDRLRNANTTLVKALLGTTCVSERNAVAMIAFLEDEGIKLLSMAKRLCIPELTKRVREVVDAQDVALGVGACMANNLDKFAGHLRELAQARSIIRRAVVELGDEPLLSEWDAGRGIWPYEDRFWGR